MLELWWWPVPATISAIVFVTIVILGVLARRRPDRARRPIMLLTLATSVVYLVWRIGFTLPEPGGWGFVAGVALLVAEIVGLTPTHTGDGYWLQARDGNIFAFGDAMDHGSPKRLGFGDRPAVALASA